MTTRRKFISSVTLASAGWLIKPALTPISTTYIGLQLYTVRDAMQKNAVETLAKVAGIGYNAVEGATYTGSQKFYGMEPKAFGRLLKQNGLIMPGNHYRLGKEKTNGAESKGTLSHDWQKAVDDAAMVGLKYMVCAYLSPAERGNADYYKKLAAQFNKAGEISKKAGIQFCYHNHDFEFVGKEGQQPYEILLKDTDQELVKMEIDLYWVTRAKQDPLLLLNKYPARFPLWHLKDMDDTKSQGFTEVGNGIIDFKRIFQGARVAGLKYFFVEQDKCPGSPFDSIPQSYSYIKKNLV